VTAQVHEELIYEGERTSMACAPEIPEGHPRIRANPDGAILCPSCGRGYVGTWEIRDGRLFLNDIDGNYRLEGEPIPADWYSGTLRVPRGRMLRYVHQGFLTSFEMELLVKVVKGRVVKADLVDNR
jgi:uncharacterized Zn-finger protein